MNPQPIEALLVEDNEDDVILIREALAGTRQIKLLAVAKDGEEAMAYLKRQGQQRNTKLPGLVFLDINMPKKDGFWVLEEMRADQTLRSIPVIMLTTSDREEDVVRSYDIGACSFVTKPGDFEEIELVMRRIEEYWGGVSRIPERRES